jgi:SPP1 family predicted phage head-tail adaptor
MPAGKRRFLITIQQSVQSDDASGQPLHTWVPYCMRYADVEQTSGTERFRGRQIDASMTHVAVIVSDSVTRLITPGMRFLWRGRIVNLMVVKPLDGKIREIQLMGQEYVQA